MRNRNSDDRGTALIGYALIVMLVGITSIVGLNTVGQGTSDSFETISDSMPGSSVAVEVELTPLEKWDKAKADYTAAINDAKATKASTVAESKASYKAEVAANKAKPKAERKAANKVSKTKYNAAKKQAGVDYKASVNAAKSARAGAKAAYNASK